MPWTFIIQLVLFFLERYLKHVGKDIDWDKAKAAMDEHIKAAVHRDRLEKIALAVADLVFDIVKTYMKQGVSLDDALERVRHIPHLGKNSEGEMSMLLTQELQLAKGQLVV